MEVEVDPELLLGVAVAATDGEDIVRCFSVAEEQSATVLLHEQGGNIPSCLLESLSLKCYRIQPPCV